MSPLVPAVTVQGKYAGTTSAKILPIILAQNMQILSIFQDDKHERMPGEFAICTGLNLNKYFREQSFLWLHQGNIKTFTKYF